MNYYQLTTVQDKLECPYFYYLIIKKDENLCATVNKIIEKIDKPLRRAYNFYNGGEYSAILTGLDCLPSHARDLMKEVEIYHDLIPAEVCFPDLSEKERKKKISSFLEKHSRGSMIFC
jgi:hypothetical protein